MKLSALICHDAILPEMAASSRDEVIRELVAALVNAGRIPAAHEATLVKAAIDREKQASTGFGKGVAVPHAKHQLVPDMVGAIGISKSGVDFNALDGQPVYSVVLLLSPANKSQQHLDAMQTIFKTLQQDLFRKFLRQVKGHEGVVELLAEADQK